MSSICPDPSEPTRPGPVGPQERSDTIAEEPLHRLAALLDHPSMPWPAGELPPLAHWLYFLPSDQQSALGLDGHPAEGLFPPPVGAPRRMWAGGRIEFRSPIKLGSKARRTSTVIQVKAKSGRTGLLSFATVRHTITVDSVVAIVEEQDLVFLQARPLPPQTPHPADLVPQSSRRMSLDPRALFRFSALTYNAHRIHYDADYARGAEGYSGLVVHGPFQALLLIDQLANGWPGLDVASFRFRIRSPLFAEEPFDLNVAQADTGFALWVSGIDGGERMTALATQR